MNEFFRVVYPEQRDVFVGGVKMGRTNRVIEIGPGTYTINLGAPRDYTPKWRRASIIDTFPDEPLRIEFCPEGDS